MMLDHLGKPEAAAAITTAMESVLAHGHHALTPDMGGNATTQDLGKAVAAALTTP